MLDAAWLQGLLNWISAHPEWSIALVFVICLLESLFILGLIIPGAFLLFGVGALVSAGGLNAYAVLVAGFLGSVVGDNLSFWLGRIWRDEIKNWRPLRKYAGFMQRGEDFFRSHGGKSILIGRMVGALRSVIPTIAGIAGMSPLTFFLINAVIQIPWLLLYVAPGMIFGASMHLLEDVGTQLLTLMAVTGGSLFVLIWLARRLFLFISRHAEDLGNRLLDWSQHHRRLGLLGPNLANPALPETPALVVLGAMLLLFSWLGSSVLWQIGGTGPAGFDTVTYHLFQRLHAPWSDALSLVLVRLGSWSVYAPMAATVLVVLLVRRHWLSAAHWAAAVVFGALLALGREALVAIPDPLVHFRNVPAADGLGALQSGHLIRSTVIYGFFAAIVATGLSAGWRWLVYVSALLLITLIGLARVYLGAQWLSDALFALTLGGLWVGALTLGYRRHLRSSRVHTAPLLVLALASIAITMAFQQPRMDTDRAHYLASPPVSRALAGWPDDAYALLPAYRSDLAEHQRFPLNLQWRAPKDEIRARLAAAGFRDRRDPALTEFVQWLNPDATFDELGLLPQTHGGRRERLLFSLPINDRDGWVLRLWDAHATNDGEPVWVGTIARYRVNKSLGIFHRPRLFGDYRAGARLLATLFPEHQFERHPDARTQRAWSGELLLLNPGWIAP